MLMPIGHALFNIVWLLSSQEAAANRVNTVYNVMHLLIFSILNIHIKVFVA